MSDKQKTAMEQLIQWCISNAFNVEGQDGTKYIAIDYEEMKEQFDGLLEIEKSQIVEAFVAGTHECKSPEQFYNQTYTK